MATQVFKIPDSFNKDFKYTFCPGCDHGVAIRLVGEVMDELGFRENTIAATAIGCSVTLYDFLNIDAIESPHGRALAVATGVKRANPDKTVFTYSGDGDFASIGLAESMHTALRGEKITSICINNTTYGMTGGQMAPTSLPGQVTQTSPYGRDVNHCGWPIRVCEMLATLEGPEYITRVAVNNVKNVRNAKKAIKKAFQNQIEGKGFSLVEVVSACPTNWGMTPKQALEWVESDMLPYYPIGVYKDRSENGGDAK